jgi:hypothetical protein
MALVLLSVAYCISILNIAVVREVKMKQGYPIVSLERGDMPHRQCAAIKFICTPLDVLTAALR